MLAQAPRPGYKSVFHRYRLGLASPKGWRGAPQLGLLPFYLQARRHHPARQFHAAQADGTLTAYAVRPLAGPVCAHCGAVADELDMWPDDAGFICQECWERACARSWWAMMAPPQPQRMVLSEIIARADYWERGGQHAIVARPMWSDSPARRLRDSRARPAALHGSSGDLGTFAALRPRRRSVYARSQGTLHYLAVRRSMVAKCQRMGLTRLRPGLWYDPASEVAYLQMRGA